MSSALFSRTISLLQPYKFPYELTGYPVLCYSPPSFHCFYFSPSIFTSHYKSPPFSYPSSSSLISHQPPRYHPKIKYSLLFSFLLFPRQTTVSLHPFFISLFLCLAEHKRNLKVEKGLQKDLLFAKTNNEALMKRCCVIYIKWMFLSFITSYFFMRISLLKKQCAGKCSWLEKMRIFPTNKTSIYSVGVMHQGSLMVLLNITLQECVGVTNLNCILNTNIKIFYLFLLVLKEHCQY